MGDRRTNKASSRPVDERQLIRARLSAERGTLFKSGGMRVALVYPSPYRVGMSSLGFQTIYRVVNTHTEHAAERAFAPDSGRGAGPLLTYESGTPVGDSDVIAFSVSYELELGGLIDCLELSGLPPLAADRSDTDPLVVVGGPITFANPLPVGPFADIVVMGEGEQAIVELLDRIAAARDKRRLLEDTADRPGFFVPALHGERLLPLLAADDALLPAYGQIRTPDTELSDMHLVEAERGCHRRCTFCVMRRSTNGGMRIAEPARILETIPDDATRVGLVGAAVTDHPQLLDIVGAIVDRGLEIGISSLRADRLTPELVGLLAAGGYRTLTVAADGASERLRKALEKSIRARHLQRAAELAAGAGLTRLKLYMMLGVPEETRADLRELVALLGELGRVIPVALAISPFVAKKNTPLDGLPFAGVDRVERRVRWLKKAVGRTLGDRIELRSTSARWAWIEYCVAQGGFEMARATLDARDRGGTFADWKAAIREHAPRFAEMRRADRGAARA